MCEGFDPEAADDPTPVKPDWRGGRQEHEAEWVRQLETWRAQRVDHVFDLSSGKSKHAYEMTDAEILDAARLRANAGAERAINEWNHRQADKRRRERQGIGL
jgi:hypothetical protein